MEEVKQENVNVQEPKKMSYEELKNAADALAEANRRLSFQNAQLRQALESRELDYTSFFLSMLFKVIEHVEMYSDEFVSWAVNNIETTLLDFAKAGAEDEKKDADVKENEAE